MNDVFDIDKSLRFLHSNRPWHCAIDKTDNNADANWESWLERTTSKSVTPAVTVQAEMSSVECNWSSQHTRPIAVCLPNPLADVSLLVMARWPVGWRLVIIVVYNGTIKHHQLPNRHAIYDRMQANNNHLLLLLFMFCCFFLFENKLFNLHHRHSTRVQRLSLARTTTDRCTQFRNYRPIEFLIANLFPSIFPPTGPGVVVLLIVSIEFFLLFVLLSVRLIFRRSNPKKWGFSIEEAIRLLAAYCSKWNNGNDAAGLNMPNEPSNFHFVQFHWLCFRAFLLDSLS